MDGFLRAQSDVFSIGYYAEHDLPFTPHVAKAFTAFDRFFCSLLSSTYPNREYMHAGQSYGKIDNSLPLGGSSASRTRRSSTRCRPRASPTTTSTPTSRSRRCGARRDSPAPARCRPTTSGRRPARCPALSFVDPAFHGRGSGHLGRRASRTATSASGRRSSPTSCTRSWSRRSTSAARCSSSTTSGAGSSTTCVPPRVPDLRASTDLNKDFGQMGLRIPAVVVSPYARRGHVDHSIYGFESILKMIRYRYGLAPLTPRDLYANNIADGVRLGVKARLHAAGAAAAAAHHGHAVRGSTPLGAGGSGAAAPARAAARREPLATRDSGRPAPERAKPHDLANLVTSGYLERLGFNYRPATPGDDVPPPVEAGDAAVRRRGRLARARWRAGAGARRLRGRGRRQLHARSRLAITVAPVARLTSRSRSRSRSAPTPARSTTPTGPLRIRVKLADECGGTFARRPASRCSTSS